MIEVIEAADQDQGDLKNPLEAADPKEIGIPLLHQDPKENLDVEVKFIFSSF